MKSFYINNKNLTCFFLLILWCLCLGSLGCGSMSWQKRTMISYEAAGEVLQASQPILRAMCEDGTLSPEDCIAARKTYNDAVEIYKIMGNAAIIAMDTGEQSVYKDLNIRLMEILGQIAEFTGRR